ncbi:MAG: PadR family transcriptional regulator [Thermoleophilaceae bacterium]
MAKAKQSKRERTRKAARQTVEKAGGLAAPRAPERAGRTRSADPITGELRRRDVLPLLVLHLIAANPSYGNQLMERIGAMTEGVLSVNPNTMYPLLRALEQRGLIEGKWEHPERRSRRYYSLTPDGRKEYRRLVKEVRPFLESTARSIDEIVREVYG